MPFAAERNVSRSRSLPVNFFSKEVRKLRALQPFGYPRRFASLAGVATWASFTSVSRVSLSVNFFETDVLSSEADLDGYLRDLL